MKNAIHSIYKKTAEAVLPPLAVSQFEEKRVRQSSNSSSTMQSTAGRWNSSL
jgi:hypothetical protein